MEKRMTFLSAPIKDAKFANFQDNFLGRVLLHGYEDNVYHYEKNRCYTLNKLEAIKNGFTEKDVRRYKRRVNLLGSAFDKYTILSCCPITLFLFNNKYYIIDGQGRYGALKKRNRSHEIKGEPLEVITAMVYSCQNESEIINAIRSSNEYPTKWNRDDKYRTEKMTAIEYANNHPDDERAQEELDLYDLIDFLESKGFSKTAAFTITHGQGSCKSGFERTILTAWDKAEHFAVFICSLYKRCLEEFWDEKDAKRLFSGTAVDVIRTKYKALCDGNDNYVNKTEDLISKAVLCLNTDKRSIINYKDRSRFRNYLEQFIDKNTKDKYILKQNKKYKR